MLKPLARPCAPVWPSAPWVMIILPLPPSLATSAWVTDAPMNSLSGARKLWTLILSSGAISVSMSITGMPASIIFFTGSVSVPMPKAWMATKSHFCEAMLSIAARCLAASSSPSNQVTSTLNSLPQNSAACLPWAHQVACRPALENAAFSGFSERPAATPAIAGFTPIIPSVAAAPPTVATVRKSRLVLSNVSVIASSMVQPLEWRYSRESGSEDFQRQGGALCP